MVQALAAGRTRWRAAVVVVTVALLLVGIPGGAQPAQASTSAEQQVVDKINDERRKNGLSALRVNTNLRGVARDWSDRMARCARDSSRSSCLQHRPNLASHVDSNVTRDWRRLGENVGYSVLTGASTTQLVDRVHNALMNSDGHRRNILGDYNQVGVGVTIASDGTLWLTQNFMHSATSGGQPTIPINLSSSAIPIAGDWNGNGQATPGWYDEGTVYLRNSHGAGGAHIKFNYGRAGDVPIVGDWNGNGRETIGILRNGRWYLKNSHSGGSADRDFRYGRLNSGDYALAGDWNGDGRDTVGIVRGGEWHLRDVNRAGHADRVFRYGRVRSGDVPVVGDWTGDGRDTPGIIRGSEWHLRHVNRAGHADTVFHYGRSNDTAVTGNWNGRGGDTPGVVRGTQWHLRDRTSAGGAHHSYEF